MNEPKSRCGFHWNEPDSIRVHFCGLPPGHEAKHQCRACGVEKSGGKR